MLLIEFNMILEDILATMDAVLKNQLKEFVTRSKDKAGDHTAAAAAETPTPSPASLIAPILPQEAADAQCDGTVARCDRLIEMIGAMLTDLKAVKAKGAVEVSVISVDGKGHFSKADNDKKLAVEELEPLQLDAIESLLPGLNVPATKLTCIESVEGLIGTMGPILERLYAVAGPRTTALAVQHHNRLFKVVDWLSHHSALRNQAMCELQLQELIAQFTLKLLTRHYGQRHDFICFALALLVNAS
eukprot:m.342803 g.342803  ORF g.342803 m.342803 type:complete len:245 (-) comp16127_c0_seq1:204-938(-)